MPKGRDIWAFSVKPDEKPFPIVQTSFNEENGQFDGQRFLMNTIIEESGSPITILLNWKPK